MRTFLCFITLYLSMPLYAGMQAIGDDELSDIDGAGMALVLEDFSYTSGNPNGTSQSLANNLEISGIKNGSGQDVKVHLPGVFLGGANMGQVNIGRLRYPVTLGVLDGDDADVDIPGKAVFQIAMPFQGNNNSSSVIGGDLCLAGVSTFGYCSSRIGQERPTLILKSIVEINGSSELYLSSKAENLVVDGTRIRFWGEGDDRLTFDFKLNAYSSLISIDDYTVTTDSPTTLSNVAIELALGYGSKQPVTFEVLNTTGHFQFEVTSLDGKCSSVTSTGNCNDSAGIDFFTDYYDNGPKGNIYIGTMTLGGKNLGSSTIENLQIQYLQVTSHDL